MQFKEINPQEISENSFKLIGKDWMLITAGDQEKVNTMTASWGGMGVMWGKNVAYVVIRPQRYTKEFVDTKGNFSLSFFDEKYRKELSYLGSVSGHNENKIEKTGLNVEFDENIPYFKEAKLVLECESLYHQEMKPEYFIDKTSDEKWYPQKDYHTLYIAEIKKVLKA